MPERESERLSDIVVSPHFDDGALSAATVLCAGASALLVTVCGGEPAEPGDDEWDRLCGFESGHAAALGRAVEDQAAAAVTGHPVLHLPVPDAPYRAKFPHGDVVAWLVEVFRPGARIWAPLGIGSHPDHAGARDAALEAAAAAGSELIFYADCPYAFSSGWDAPDHGRPEADRWAPPLAAVADLIDATGPQVVQLDDAAMRKKIAMLRCHGSQLAGLSVDYPNFVAWHGPLRREVFWPAVTMEASA